MRHLSEGSTTASLSQMPEKEDTYIRTCGKIQEVVGFSCTHSTPTTLLPDCRLQSSQPCLRRLLCHTQRPALTEQWQKSILQRRNIFTEEGGFLWVKELWGVGRMQWGWRGSSRDSLWQWSLIKHLAFEKAKNITDVKKSKSQPCNGQCSNGNSRPGSKLLLSTEVEQHLLFSQGMGNL